MGSIFLAYLFTGIFVWGFPQSNVATFLFYMTVFYYAFGFKNVKLSLRRRIVWFWPPFVTRYAQSWHILFAAAVVWTFIVCVFSFIGLAMDSAIGNWAATLGASTVDSIAPKKRIADAFISSPGILAVAAGLSFTLAGLLNTIALLNQKLDNITSFQDLFFKMNELTQELVERNPRSMGSHSGGVLGEPLETVYLLDYTPLIGEISRADFAREVYKLLEQLRSVPSCECHFVFLASKRFEYPSLIPSVDEPPRTPEPKCPDELVHHQPDKTASGATSGQFTTSTESIGKLSTEKQSEFGLLDGDLEKFYKRLLGRSSSFPNHDYDEFSARVRDYVEKAEERIKRLDGDNVAVWRSRKIHSEHYLVSRESALQYYVTPEPNGDRNELKGERTSDLSQVEFLKEVVQDYIRDAITPHIEVTQISTVNFLEMSFDVGQSGIEAIELYVGKNPQDIAEEHLTRCNHIFYIAECSEESYPESIFKEVKDDATLVRIDINLSKPHPLILAGKRYKAPLEIIDHPQFDWIRIRLRKCSSRFSNTDNTARPDDNRAWTESWPSEAIAPNKDLVLYSPFSYRLSRKLAAKTVRRA